MFASISPYVSAKSPTAEVDEAGQVEPLLVRGVASTRRSNERAATMPRTPTGTLTKKIQLQSMCSVMSPPTSGPIASAIADTPAQMPIAIPRCRGGNVAVMIASVAGFIIAAPTPCTHARADEEAGARARPQASDATVKIDEADDEDRRRRRACPRACRR